jgi:metal-responsive CopG/Arc/MetJ family transcriptional regulator
MAMPRFFIMSTSPYQGGKKRFHFSLTEDASKHLSDIASEAQLSRSETLERIIRSLPSWEGNMSFSNEAWSACIDYVLDEDTDRLLQTLDETI